MLNKILLTLMLLITSEMNANPLFNLNKKMYIDDSEFKAEVQDDAFHIHVGDNLWLVTSTVHRDGFGLYTYENDLSRINMEYEKKWKCPYCNRYYPEGKPCSYKECPSKYK